MGNFFTQKGIIILMKIKHLTIATMATLMCLSSSMMNVFADDTSTDDHTTNINYEVGESYKWQAPADLIFTKNVDNEVLTGSVSVLENIIEAGKTLVISIGPDEDFKLTSAEGAQRDYKVNKEAEVLSAGSKVLSVPSGTYDGAQDLDFELQGVVSGNISQKAGIYTGTLNFAATLENSGSGSGGGTSTPSVTKGNIVTLSELGLTNVDINNDSTTDTFRVLSADGTNVKLLAMDSYKSAYFNSAGTNTYSGSTLDTEMTNYYNVLPGDVKGKIVAQDITQSVYSYSDPMSSENKSSTNPVGSRSVYALDVDDVIEYLGSDYTASPCTALREMFFNTTESVSRDVWLRSANAASTNSAFYVDGLGGFVLDSSVDDYECEVRPAFVLNLG